MQVTLFFFFLRPQYRRLEVRVRVKVEWPVVAVGSSVVAASGVELLIEVMEICGEPVIILYTVVAVADRP